MFLYPTISDYRRKQMMVAAQTALGLQQQWAESGQSLLHLMLQHHNYDTEDMGQRFFTMRHYPKGDRIDYTNGSQYFYHCHREDMDTGEHGHFHTFIRGKFFPKSARRMQIPDANVFDDKPMTHLICIALDTYGQPCRLFTVNRWVSRETIFDAPTLKRSFIKRFDATHVEGDNAWQPIDCWITAIINVFRPQIEYLIEERDAELIRQKEHHKDENIYMNKTIEELSSLPISLQQQVQWLIAPKD